MVISSTRSSETISRTPSASSLELSNTSLSAVEPRRTRKRITPCQLEHLEELYRQSSHPTREQRDVLGRRIQMETKSVTIWFQNKRQTDRKVALHKATYSQTIERNKTTEESIPSASAFETPCNPMKRTSSYASSVSSTSSTSSTAKRPSLDRVASRSEIRFIDKQDIHASKGVMKRESSALKRIVSTSSSRRDHTSPLISPASPVRTSGALWSHMLSSPIAPSSPPPVELVAYSRTRKTRTLDWACTVARLSSKDEDFSKGSLGSSLGPAFGTLKQDVVMSEREYEDAIGTTEDEAELVTPQASQAAFVSWPPHGDKRQVTVTEKDDRAEGGIRSVGVNSMDKILTQKHPWQEEEVHAALALCGLRG